MLKELGTVVEARAADRIRSLLDKVGFFLRALQSMISVADIIGTACSGGRVVFPYFPVTISDASG
jgi:hypothetical protein